MKKFENINFENYLDDMKRVSEGINYFENVNLVTENEVFEVELTAEILSEVVPCSHGDEFIGFSKDYKWNATDLKLVNSYKFETDEFFDFILSDELKKEWLLEISLYLNREGTFLHFLD